MCSMDMAQVGAIAREVCELLQLQVESVAGRNLKGFTKEELKAYDHGLQ